MSPRHKQFCNLWRNVERATSNQNLSMASLGLVKRKNCRVLTIRGWIVLFIVATAILLIAIPAVHPFLAVDHPVHGEILIVEGWLPDYAMEEAMREFKAQRYNLLVTTGGPLMGGSHLSEYKTYAELGAATLKKLGFDEKLIVAVPAQSVIEDRTYASAVALKNWLLDSRSAVKSLNVYSFGPHARRTWLLFDKVLGDKIAVGVIAAEDRSYDPRKWWTSSNGARSVIDEMIAYCYARLFF